MSEASFNASQGAPSPPAAANRGRRRFVVVLLGLVVLWVVVMLFRWELRTRWWAWRLTEVESREDRQYYLTRLAAVGDRSLDAVPRLLHDGRPEVRDMGLTVLRYCESPRAGALLLEMLDDEAPDVAAMAASLLAWRPEARAYVPQLFMAIQTGQGREAWAAAIALGRIGGPDVEQLLLTVVHPKMGPDIRAQVIESLGLLNCGAAVPAMIDALADRRSLETPPFSQRNVARAIGSLQGEIVAKGGDPGAMMAAAETPTVASVAAQWLTMMTGGSFGDPTTQPADRTPEIQRAWREAWKARGQEATTRPQ